MKKVLSVIAVAAGLTILAGAAAAHWSGGSGWGGPSGMGPGMMGGGGGRGWMAGNVPCAGYTSATEEITADKAKDLAQTYADQYLKGFTVERVLPFTGMHHTMYSAELKNPDGEIRTLHINPFGNVMPFGGPWRQDS
jgi:hypothetical protein